MSKTKSADQPVPASVDRYRDRISAVLDVLGARNGERMSLADLAETAAMSPFHFHRVFSALTGETVGSVSRRLRMAEAVRALRDTDAAVTEIALDAGYETPQNFAKAFKGMTGVTPSQARADAAVSNSLLPRLVLPRFIIMKEYTMSNVSVQSVPAFATVAVHHQGPYEAMGPAFERLLSWTGEQGLMPKMQGLFGVFYSDPFAVKPEDCHADACAQFEGGVEPGEGMISVALGGGDHAVLLHSGPYERLRESYDALYGRWLPQSGREPADKPPFEKYLNDPTTTKPEDLRTEIYLPLK